MRATGVERGGVRVGAWGRAPLALLLHRAQKLGPGNPKGVDALRKHLDPSMPELLPPWRGCGVGVGAPTLRIMWAAACQPRVPMCLLKEMLRWMADS